MTVPLDVDTVTVMLWTRYIGDPSSAEPRGTMSLAAADGTVLERVMTMAGLAPEYYPESRTIGGVRGRTLRLSLRRDEHAVAGGRGGDGRARAAAERAGGRHGGRAAAVGEPGARRQRRVRVAVRRGGAAGDLLVYDFTGRLVFRTGVQPASERVVWPLGDGPMANGAYVVIARSGGRTTAADGLRAAAGAVIVGIGMDLIDIARVERLLADKGDRALRRLFTEGEAAYACRAASRRATSPRAWPPRRPPTRRSPATSSRAAVGWRDIEVVSEWDGRPTLALHGRAAERAAELGVRVALLTLTHSDASAAAVVILQGVVPNAQSLTLDAGHRHSTLDTDH